MHKWGYCWKHASKITQPVFWGCSVCVWIFVCGASHRSLTLVFEKGTTDRWCHRGLSDEWWQDSINASCCAWTFGDCEGEITVEEVFPRKPYTIWLLFSVAFRQSFLNLLMNSGLLEKVLLTSGANIDAKDNDGKTALALAQEHCHDNIYHLLRDAGDSSRALLTPLSLLGHK